MREWAERQTEDTGVNLWAEQEGWGDGGAGVGGQGGDVEEGRSGGGYSQLDEDLFQDRLSAGFASVCGLAQVNMRTKSRHYFHKPYQVPARSQCHHSKYLFDK